MGLPTRSGIDAVDDMVGPPLSARRPIVVIPGRLSDNASALRHSAVVTARALIDAVWRAGGEPLTVAPRETMDVARRLGFAEAILLPGGGDLDPSTYGQQPESDEIYDVDATQDAFDLAVARWAVAEGLPLLAICRGMQVLNVARGGTIEQHMAVAHRHRRHRLRVDRPLSAVLGTDEVEISCFHHQRVAELGDGLRPVAFGDDGTVEALSLVNTRNFVAAVQWHPEDTAATDSHNQALFDELVRAAR